mmetsp:Transcript_4122/g.11244  ORF Transcript_4122/g.11244 Transcript_4122/m.11244 type:complete len:252 (-) Transcript_4122:101-856(-)
MYAVLTRSVAAARQDAFVLHFVHAIFTMTASVCVGAVAGFLLVIFGPTAALSTIDAKKILVFAPILPGAIIFLQHGNVAFAADKLNESLVGQDILGVGAIANGGVPSHQVHPRVVVSSTFTAVFAKQDVVLIQVARLRPSTTFAGRSGITVGAEALPVLLLLIFLCPFVFLFLLLIGPEWYTLGSILTGWIAVLICSSKSVVPCHDWHSSVVVVVIVDIDVFTTIRRSCHNCRRSEQERRSHGSGGSNGES